MKYMKMILAVAAVLLLLCALVPAAGAEAIVPPGQQAGDADKGSDEQGDTVIGGKEEADPAGEGEFIQPNAGSGEGSFVVDPDEDYQGNVILPEEPQEEDDEDDQNEGWTSVTPQPVLNEDGLISINSSMSYDAATGMFIYEVGDSGTVVKATVAHGMIVTDSVRVVGATLLIYKDGKRWEENTLQKTEAGTVILTEPGEYVVMAQTGNETPRLFTFTLAGSAVSDIYAYSLPSGMYVTNATLNGEDTDYDRTTVPMQEDGLYHIEYEFLSTGRTYVLDLNIDRTPPELQFDGKIDENNRVHSALSFSGVQEGDTVLATLDGSPIDVNVRSDGTGEFTQSGSYVITVYDAAGNSTVYGYIVLLYLNASSLAFFAVLVGSAAAVAVYVIIKRKRLEIG